ncbi:nucleotidyltransferase family protein [Halarsenatibacter silvermanii]|uniref:Polymerase beta nucleotidyltransferase domain-containing protein n=1 Tax=Halarsenatibacter silvermanii TaxID=321763 RepID=A0A1G9U7S2_9FIRM|nr:nucleotidyltransferase domain-containing protein [Halarsenatibacter silvermanii]SDM56037.1 hypothetical protein SAMN04488692_1633 [Halarsenatibacter silvermanii]
MAFIKEIVKEGKKKVKLNSAGGANMEEYYNFLKNREEQKRQKVNKFRERKRNDLKQIINELAAEIDSLELVIIFGSFLENNARRPNDIDIYMEKIPAEKYFILRRKLEEALEMPVDLHTQTKSHDFIKKIKRKGEVLLAGEN